MHNKRMSALCNGWGLGVETAEYWHWLSRNYRIFADLLDISETTIVGEQEIEEAIKMITGDSIVNLDQVLHHPGYYYFMAADSVRQEHCRRDVTTAATGMSDGRLQ
jgi:trafficking protein particle complex subunit 11